MTPVCRRLFFAFGIRVLVFAALFPSDVLFHRVTCVVEPPSFLCRILRERRREEEEEGTCSVI